MSRRFTLPVALGAMALALAACPQKPVYPQCKTDEHCKEHGQVCVNGQCQECGQDTDCKEGFICQDNRCVPKPECAADADCPEGLRCRDGKCQPECATDEECAAGMQCMAGRCAPKAECLSDEDCGAGRRCENQRCVEGIAGCDRLGPVYFGFDEYTLTSEAQRTLDKVAECLKARRGKTTVTIAGHADERGTEEYNLHLGERRANAVRRYLTTLGVGQTELRTVSYGEERPAAYGHDEASWAQNRRAEFME